MLNSWSLSALLFLWLKQNNCISDTLKQHETAIKVMYNPNPNGKISNPQFGGMVCFCSLFSFLTIITQIIILSGEIRNMLFYYTKSHFIGTLKMLRSTSHLVTGARNYCWCHSLLLSSLSSAPEDIEFPVSLYYWISVMMVLMPVTEKC